MESLLQLSARADAHERHEEQYGADSTAAKKSHANYVHVGFC